MQRSKSTRWFRSLLNRAHRLTKGAGGTTSIDLVNFEPLETRQLLAVITWDGGPGGTGSSWSDPVNWAGNVLPGPNDDVIIGPGTTAVSLSTSSTTTSIRSLNLQRVLSLSGNGASSGGLEISQNASGSGNLTISSSRLAVSGSASFSGEVALNSSVLSIGQNGSFSRNVTVSSSTIERFGDVSFIGPVTWQGGWFEGGGRTLIPSSTTFDASSFLSLRGTLENSGTMRFTNSASLSLGASLTPGNFVNRASGLVTIDFASSGSNWGESSTNPSNSFLNEGRIEKLGEGSVSFSFQSFLSTGSLEVRRGSFGFSSSSNRTGETTGSVTVDTLASFNARDHTFAASSVISGAGAVTFFDHTIIDGTVQTTGRVNFSQGNGSFIAPSAQLNGTITNASLISVNWPLTLNASQTWSNEVQIGANIDGPGDLTLNGLSNWFSGGLTGTGRAIVGTAGRLTVSNMTLARTLENRGILDFASGNGSTAATLGTNLTPGIIINNAGAVINLLGGADLSAFVLNSANRITNLGTINKEGGNTSSISSLRFDNAGTVNILGGSFETLTTSVIGGFSSGTFNITPQSALRLGNHTLNAGTRLIGGGEANFTGAITIAGAIVNESLLHLLGTTTINANLTLGGSFELSGTLAGSGTVTLTGQNSFWNGNAIMRGTGRTILAQGASMFVASSAILGRTLENRGTLNFIGTADLLFGSGGLPGIIENTNTGIANFANSMGLRAQESNVGNTFRNFGVVNKESAQFVSFSGVNFSNPGVVNVRGGNLSIGSAGTALVNASNGIFDIGVGSSLRVTNQAFGNGTVFRGFGQMFFDGNENSIVGNITSTIAQTSIPGTLSVDVNTTFGGTVLLLGTLTGSADVTFSSSLDWSQGSMVGSGRTIIPTGARMDLSTGPSSPRILARTLENRGTVNAISSTNSLSFGEGIDAGVLLNRSGGTITITNGVRFFRNVSNANNLFVNEGLITKLGSSSTDFSVESFNNLGTINVLQGSLSMSGGTSSGSIDVNAGASVSISSGTNTVTLLGGTTFRGLGAINLSGTVNITGSINNSATLTFQGGTATIGQSSTLGGRVIFGSMNLTGPGDLTLTGQNEWFPFFSSWSGTGKVIIAAGGSLSIPGNSNSSSQNVLAKTIENFGQLIFPTSGNGGMNLNLGTATSPGIIINRPSGIMRFTDTQGTSISTSVSNPLNAIINEGRIEKTTTSSVSFSGASFSNSGTVFVERGILTIFRVNSLVGGSFDIRSSGRVDLPAGVTMGATQSLIMSPESELTINGGLAIATTNPDLFRPSGSILLSGGVNPISTLEAASQNRGATSLGFDRNFAFGRLSVQSGTLRLVDSVRNRGTAAESVYANSLVVPSNTILDLNGLQLFTRSAQINGTVRGGTVTIIADGGPLPITAPSQGNIEAVGQVDEWTIFARKNNTLNVFINPGTQGITAPVGGPSLQRVRVELLSPTGAVIATRTNAALTAGSQIELTGLRVPTTGSYRVRVSAPSEFASSTGRYSLWYYEGNVNELNGTVNAPVVGSIDSSYGINRLTFSEVGGQNIRLDVAPGTNPRIKFSLRGPLGEDVFTSISSTSEVFRLPSTGEYTLTVQGEGDQTGGYGFTIRRDALRTLPLNGAVQGEIAGSGGSMLYRLDVTSAKPLQIALDDLQADNRNEIYVRYGSAPTRQTFDYRFENEASADQRVSIPRAQAGTWYVLVYTPSAAAQSTYTLSSRASEVFLNESTPTRNSILNPVVLTLDGAGFRQGSVVELVSGSGQVIQSTEVTVTSPTRLMARFAREGLAVGQFSVRVRDLGGDVSTLANALELTSEGTPRLETRLTLPQTMNTRSNGTILIEYANTGTASMPAPILQLQSGDADNSDLPRLTLDQSLAVRGVWTSARPDGFAGFVQILASGATPGILNPGERFTVSVFYAGGDGRDDGAVELELRSYESTDTTPINWPSLRDSLRPASISNEAWTPVFGNLTTSVGSTWGGFVSAISTSAQFLGMINRNVTDVRELFAYQVQQAIGFSPIPTLASSTDAAMSAIGLGLDFSRSYSSSLPSRFSQGLFGRGWSTPWATRLQFDSDGSVNLTNGGTGQRRFQPDSRSRNNPFFSSPGETSKLFRTGAVWQLREVDGSVTQFSNTGRLDFIRDRYGNRITAEYTGSRLTALTHSSGQQLKINYNTSGLIQSISDTVGRFTNFEYDTSSQYLLSSTSFDGQTTFYTYDQTSTDGRRHALTSVTRGGVTQFYQYDANGRLSRSSLANDAESKSYTYSIGRITTVDAAGGRSRVDFDHRGQVARLIDALDRATLMEYTDEGRLSQIIDPLGQTRSFTWNAVGQPTSVTDELGHTTRFEYDTPFSLLSRFTDAAGNSTQYVYDERGSLLSTIYPNGSADFQSSNTLGQITSYTNRRGQVITFTYNSAGQLTEQRATDGTYSLFTYDERGNMLTAANANTTLSYVYDPTTNRLTSVTYADGRSLSFTYDAFLRREKLIDETGWMLQYAYNNQGRLESVRDARGVSIISFGYDKVGRLATEEKLNGTSTTYTYDLAGQLIDIVNRRPNGAISTRFTYTYDELGRPVSQTTVDGNWTYDYDVLGQLVRAEFISTNPLIHNHSLEYEYDSIGNWTRTTNDSTTTAYVSNSLGQYTNIGTESLTYDADGNLTVFRDRSTNFLLTYDAFGQASTIRSGDAVSRLQYDAFRRLVSLDRNSSPLEFTHDPFDGSVQSIRENLTKTNVISAFGVASASRNGQFSFFEYDSVGSLAAVSDSVGLIRERRSFNPFGQMQLSSIEGGSNESFELFGFNGRFGVTAVSSGILLMGSRLYTSNFGRFNSVDLARAYGGLGSTYSFAINSPISWVDPAGFKPQLSIVFQNSRGIEQRLDNFLLGLDNIEVLEADTPEEGLKFSVGWIVGTATSNVVVAAATWAVSPFIAAAATTVTGVYIVTLLPIAIGVGVGLYAGYKAEQFAENSLIPWLADFDWSDDVLKPITVLTINSVNGVISAFASAANEIRVGGLDPNDIIGPAGFGSLNFIRPNQDLPYRIRFENFGPGSVDTEGNPIPVFTTGPAQRVEVVQRLDDRLDLSTFRFTGFGFGDVRLTPDQPTQSFNRTLAFTFNNRTFNVVLEAFVDTFARELVVTLNAVDPRTQLPPELVTGFLPPEDGTGRGQGFITYTVRPVAGLATGTPIRSIANIVFDGNPPIPTNQIDPLDASQGTSPDREALITIDADRPTSRVLALSPTSSNRKWLQVSWLGEDVGAGIQSFDIFVSKNNGPFTLWRSRTSLTSDFYRVDPGNSYSFYSIARDQVGNVEDPPAVADATTFVLTESGTVEVGAENAVQSEQAENPLRRSSSPSGGGRGPELPEPSPQPITAPLTWSPVKTFPKLSSPPTISEPAGFTDDVWRPFSSTLHHFTPRSMAARALSSAGVLELMGQ
jgi:RHS repeat-associated protein